MSQEPSLLVIGLEAGLPEPLGLLLELHVHRHPQLLLGRLARLLQDLRGHQTASQSLRVDKILSDAAHCKLKLWVAT